MAAPDPDRFSQPDADAQPHAQSFAVVESLPDGERHLHDHAHADEDENSNGGSLQHSGRRRRNHGNPGRHAQPFPDRERLHPLAHGDPFPHSQMPGRNNQVDQTFG